MEHTIAIVGLGLIGGSLALALKMNTSNIVIGIDRDEAVLAAARKAGAADKTGTDYLSEADMVILALSPEGEVRFLEEHVPLLREGTIITDVCGIKREVMKRCAPLCAAHSLYFVGGHPMAGKEKSGFANAEDTLFFGASYIFTPPQGTPPEVMESLRELAFSIGCKRVTVTTPEEHDRMIAFTSQLPHVLAGAYVKSPRCADHTGYSAGSFRDVSRVATVDEKLWTQLFLLNKDNLCGEIDTLIENLQACRDALAAGEASRVENVLREGRIRKEGLGE